MTETIYDYDPPVSQLLTLGDCREMREWPDYLALGLNQEHIPELIRMALDEELHWADSDSAEVWAPIHAWRSLGQLQAEEAITPLFPLFKRIDDHGDDWVDEEVPEVYGMIGPAAIPALTNALADSDYGLWARVNLAAALAEVGQRHPEARADCVTRLTNQLKQYANLDPALNASLISYLLDLKAVESAPVIEQAYAAAKVDLAVCGDWEDAQIELGLLAERLTPRPNYMLQSPLFSQERPETEKFSKPESPEKQRKAEHRDQRQAKTKAKQKRKQAKKQRKQQRKKKKK